MDPIYGTNKNKYLQSIAGSDYYRTPSTLRPMANEYASYQNTLGRRSTLVGPYTHMSKYSYPTDVSVSSHYGYTSWGLWRDSRNLSSSLYAKKQKNIKSFSILLMSAAFIVVLAVLCVAGLAFYFSTFKTDLSESILAFDCTFRVSRGDIYTTGLRTNSTPVYRQKTAFYERLIDTSLEHSGLTVSRAEIMSFGDGPTIVLSFRVFLDMRKIKITINNVEEHIRTAFLSEVLNPNSPFKSIRIDPDSIEIKRLLDQDVLKTALLTRQHETYPSGTMVKPSQSAPPSSDHTETRHVTKKTGVIEKTIHKFTPRVPASAAAPAPDTRGGSVLLEAAESDIDMDNLPVIQGSFEITKTDADITQKRMTGSTEPAGHGASRATTVTLKPFTVSPVQLAVGGGSAAGKPKYETATAKIEKMDKHGATTKKIKTTSASKAPSAGGGRRSTYAAASSTTRTPSKGSRSTTTTTAPTTTTTTSTTTTTTTPLPSTTPLTQVARTTSRLTTLRYQVLASQPGLVANTVRDTSSSSSSMEPDDGEGDDDGDAVLLVGDELPYESYGVDPTPPTTILTNDTLLETIFQAILNDSMPEDLSEDQRRRRVDLEPDSIPKLDVNLFTSAPVLDKQPWHPISQPNQQQQQPVDPPGLKADQRTGLAGVPPRKKPSLAEEILYRNRPSDIESSLPYTENPNGQIYYQSYTNPSFGSSTLGIEPLGVLDVRPYPLPVDKIHEEVIPDFKYLTPTAVDASEQLLNLTLLDEHRFEHLGDGVIAKKPESPRTPDTEQESGTATTTAMMMEESPETTTTVTTVTQETSSEESNSTESYYGQDDGPELSSGGGGLDDGLVDVAMDLESRHSPDDEQQLLAMTTTTTTVTDLTSVTAGEESGEQQLTSTTSGITSGEGSSEEQSSVTTPRSEEVTTTTTSGGGSGEVSSEVNRTSTTYVEVETVKYTPTVTPPTTITLPELFPITKWEFVNGTRRTTVEKPPTRKVFNETLQALVVENVQPEVTTVAMAPPGRLPSGSVDLEDLKASRVNATTNLQNLSDIFDTLASKLGIQPEASGKLPPFSSLSKIKNQYRNTVNRTGAGGGRPRTTTTTVMPTTTTTMRVKRKKTRPTVPRTTTSTTSTPAYRTRTESYPETTTPLSRVIPTVTNDEIDDVVPVMLESSSEVSSSSAAASSEVVAVVGQAEVEVIDPNRYEEMLNSLAIPSGSSHRTTTVAPPSTLVTLLPVKSNSGIRNFRPKTKRPASASASLRRASTEPSVPVAHNQDDKNESRKMAVGGKLMNANKTDDDDSRPPSGTGTGSAVPVAASAHEERGASQSPAVSTSKRHPGSNKNNTMVETVVRASMRFDS
ncbi:uncharacterized protein LOC126577783 [Anopheles aquasalis]|uniref:uncharacterized protein LOC126577783 n=1 Tax=Anopheles aquasalis TaxID=42839 RepID=UPI00215A49AC|nr:uncharacterized protein LOC126577783 [Anopheles aquasalis]